MWKNLVRSFNQIVSFNSEILSYIWGESLKPKYQPDGLGQPGADTETTIGNIVKVSNTRIL